MADNMSLRVLLTGANGYIAQQILTTFLQAGHSVRGVVRSQAKADQLAKSFNKYVSDSKLDFGVVPDMTAPNAFDAVLKPTQDAAAGSSFGKPFDVVLHSASPYTYRAGLDNSGFITPAIQGTASILKSVASVAPTVKRVVITSSMAAVRSPTGPVKTYTENDWNETTMAEALSTKNMSVAYQASKRFAEQAAWDFVRDNKPNFDVVALNPPAVYGPVADPDILSSPDDLAESPHYMYLQTLAPGLSESSPVEPARLHLTVDVRDLAKAHLLGATVKEAGGKRFIIFAEQGGLSNQRVCNIMRERLPELRNRIPKGDPENWRLPENVVWCSSERARTVLGLKFRTHDETVGDFGEQMVGVMKRAGLL